MVKVFDPTGGPGLSLRTVGRSFLLISGSNLCAGCACAKAAAVTENASAAAPARIAANILKLRSETDGEADAQDRIDLEAVELVLQRPLLSRRLVLERRALRRGEAAAVGVDRRLGATHEHRAEIGVEVHAHAGDAAPADAEVGCGAVAFHGGVEAAGEAVRRCAGGVVLVVVEDHAAGEAERGSERMEVEQRV